MSGTFHDFHARTWVWQLAFKKEKFARTVKKKWCGCIVMAYSHRGLLKKLLSNTICVIFLQVIELPLTNPELFQRVGISPPKGCLLFGPPGDYKLPRFWLALSFWPFILHLCTCFDKGVLIYYNPGTTYWNRQAGWGGGVKFFEMPCISLSHVGMDVVSLWKGSHVGQKRKSASEVIGAWLGGEKKAGKPADFVLRPAIHPLAIFL